MWRYLAGGMSSLMIVAAGFFLWQASADKPQSSIPPKPEQTLSAPLGLTDAAPPPAATERTREQKRFARYDRDKNGAVGRDEYLYSRQRAFQRLDSNGDGRIDFNEYAVKASVKFAGADRDKNGALGPAEFATTRVIRKSKPKPNCPPARQAAPMDESEES